MSPRTIARSGLPLTFVIPRTQRLFLLSLSAAWMLFVAILAYFWFSTTEVVSQGRFIFNTILIIWNISLPPYFFWYVSRMRRVDPTVPLPKLRVAMVVTKTPAEPWTIVRRTLVAALAQEPAHDVWLLDEAPTLAVKRWCAEQGVSISTRNGHPLYNNLTWPRKTKTKEGNLAYFYDTVGYERYDVVVQMDADHAPAQGYLSAVLRPFCDPRIGYVAAPNLGDSNLKTSWAARARLYGESVMNGSMQAGYNVDGAPICIGSHYAIRTAALKASGGIGPELAEDYTTTVMLQANGWRGAFAYDAVANGFGPETFADLVIQDYQWAKSLTRVLFGFIPRYFLKLRPTTWPRFILPMLWYPMTSLAMACGLILPIIAVATELPMVRVSYTYFLLFSLPTIIVPGLTFLWLRHRGWLRPMTMRLISWETVLFQFARWPWTLAGCIAGAWEMATGSPASFVVTPKGNERPTPTALLLPYAGIIALVVFAMRFWTDAGEAIGYHYFLMLVGIAYTTLIATVIYTERHTYSVALSRFRFATAFASALFVLFGMTPVATPALQMAFHDAPRIPSQAYAAIVGQFASAERADIEAPEPKQDIWTVSEGEHLWSIAVARYNNGLRYVDIQQSNQPLLYSRSDDGTIIWPGDRLALPR